MEEEVVGEVAAVEVAEVGENRHAVLILFKHGKQQFFRFAKRTSQHQVLRFVQPGKLFVAQVVGVVKGVVTHRARSALRGEIS